MRCVMYMILLENVYNQCPIIQLYNFVIQCRKGTHYVPSWEAIFLMHDVVVVVYIFH